VSALFRYLGDGKELPDSCAYGDTVAYWEDFLNLAFIVKSYWEDKEKETTNLLSRAKRGV
jgi:hypothetical protein